MINRKLAVGSAAIFVTGVLGFVGFHVSGGTQPEPAKQAGDVELKKQLTLIQSSLVGARAELIAAQAKLDAAEKQLAILQLGSANLDKTPKERREVLYQGKPASHWLEMLKDRDQATILKAMRALAAIGEVDHSVISTVIDSLPSLRIDEFVKEDEPFACHGVVIIHSMMDRVKLTAQEKVALIPHLVSAERYLPCSYAFMDPEQWYVENFKDSSGPGTSVWNFLIDLNAENPQFCATQLAKLVTDRSPHIRWLGMVVARKLGPKAKAASPEICRALVKKETRYAAAYALAHIAGPDSAAGVPALLEKEINQNSLDALKVAGPAAKAAIPRLVEFINRQDTTEWAKVEATTILGSFGPEAKAAIPAVVNLLAHLESRVPELGGGSADQIVDVRKALERMGYKQR